MGPSIKHIMLKGTRSKKVPLRRDQREKGEEGLLRQIPHGIKGFFTLDLSVINQFSSN